MSSPTFKTSEVAQLYEQIGGWCNPEFPFLAPKYSPGSNIPAIDFTLYIANWLAGGRETAIEELWDYLTPHGQASRYALRKALNVNLPSWIQLPDTVRHELHAIYILTMRAALCSNYKNIADVGSWLTATTLACQHLSLPPDYDRGGWTAEMTRATNSMQIAPSYSNELLEIIRSELDSDSWLCKEYGKDKGATLAMEKALSPLEATETVSEKLKLITPMARFVVYDYVYRGWGHGLLRFSLYYEQREYGCGSEANQYYVEWLGFFGQPSDNASVPAAVTKDILREALVKEGIEVKKSGTRKEMIEKAHTIPGLLSKLIIQTYPEQSELLSEWECAVKEWALRVRYIESVARAFLKIMALKGLK